MNMTSLVFASTSCCSVGHSPSASKRGGVYASAASPLFTIAWPNVAAGAPSGFVSSSVTTSRGCAASQLAMRDR